MTFKHKLSARLARLRYLVIGAVVTAAAVAACELPLARGSGGDPATTLIVFPQALAIHPSQTIELMAVGFTAASDTGNVNVSWSVTGGSIISTRTNGGRHYGQYKAGPDTGRVFVVALADQPTGAPALASGVASASTAGLADTAVVSVVLVPVSTVTVTPAAVSVLVGASVQLAAVTQDSAGGPLSGRPVTWVSRAPAVATVNNAGLVTGAAAGSTRIIATSEGKSDSSVVTVTTVAAPVASVSVTPGSPGIQVGQTVQLTATPRDSNGTALGGRTVTWGSGNPTVATVNGTGLVAGATVGSATITATSEGQSGSASVTVAAAPVPVASVDVTPATAGIQVGQTVQLTATPRDASGNALSGRTVTWLSSSASVATVTSSGLVSGIAAGSATITATSEGQSGNAAIAVTNVPVASVTVTPSSANVPIGGTVQLTGVARDASGSILSGRPMAWTSSNVQIATVVAGLVTGVAAGTATITATSEGQSGTSAITVAFVPVASVTVSPSSATLVPGQTVQLTATPRDATGTSLSGRAVTWASSNPTIAAVNATGLVTGVAVGSATISATAEGQSGLAAITVMALPSPGQCGAWPAAITAWIAPLAPSTGQAFYAAPTGSDANPGTLAAPWRSIAKANALQPGQILYLRSGTYGARGTTFNFSVGGTAAAPITVSGYPGDARPIIQGMVIISGTYLRLTQVILDGPTGNVGGPGPNGNAVLLTIRGSHTEFSYSEVRYDYWHAGIAAVDLVSDYRLIGNYVHDNGGLNGDYNDGQWNTSHGVYASPASYGLIANNIFEHNDAKGISARHDVNHLLMINNTFVGNGRYGIATVGGSHDIIAANNVVLNNGVMGKGGGGIYFEGPGPHAQINNVYWNNNGADRFGGTVTGALFADPLLVQPSSGTVPHQIVGDPGTDNRLQATSPAIGHADPAYALPFDIIGKCRGANPDAGAYQH